MNHSTRLAQLSSSKASERLSDAALYLRWLEQCWTHHRAAKVVRVRDPGAFLSGSAQLGEDGAFKVVYLLRDHEQVISSRLSLRAFRRQGYFNPTGGPAGVAQAVCRAVDAMTRLSTRVSPLVYRLCSYASVLQSPVANLCGLYAWLGLGSHVPSSVISAMDACKLGNSTATTGKQQEELRPHPVTRDTGG
jgi:hypothetical protein